MAVSKFASIRPRTRKNGTVAYDVRYNLGGKSKTLSFETHKKANEWASIVHAIGSDQAVAILQEHNRGSVPTVDEWAEKYISQLSGVEGRTIEHYRMFMRVSISPALGPLPLTVVDDERISGWVNGMKDQYSGKTIANRHGFLYALFQYGVEKGAIARNPCAKTRLPESESGEMVFLSVDEYRTLLSFIPDRHKPLIQFLTATGARWGEAAALKPGDFDLGAGVVRISRAWKRSAERGWYTSAPKTKRSKRTISLPPSLIAELAPLVRARGEWVFTNRDGSPIRHQKFSANVWYPARRLANGLPAFADRSPIPGGPWDREPAVVPIDKWPGLHALRHTMASWLINDGVSIAVVQARLGHESVNTTIRRYTHLTPDVLYQPAAAIDRIWAGPPQAVGHSN